MRPEPGANRLLANAALAEEPRLRTALEPVHLVRGDVLAVAGELQEHVYFPTGCLVSVCVQLSNGPGAHVGLIGSEGFVGLPVLLETEPGAHRLVCQIGGAAWRMSAQRFRGAVQRGAAFRRVLLRYAGVRLLEETQHLACVANHSVSPRLARWLLIARDRIGSDNLQLTQEFLSQVLAVRRPYLTGVMQRLQQTGYIRYRRGRIAIIDHPGLEAAACDDYSVLRDHYGRLFG